MNRRANKTNGKGGDMYRLNEEQTAAIEERRRVADESIAPHAADVRARGSFPLEAADALASMELDRKNFLGDECKSSAMS
jgi:hypothetical protein